MNRPSTPLPLVSALRFHRKGRTLASLVCALVVSGCGAKTNDDRLESNTNWLSQCDRDAECGEDLACRCGVCTMPCDGNSCPAALECLAVSECGGSGSASCQAQCGDDGDCAGLDVRAECIDGVCAMTSGGISTSLLSGEPNPSSSPDSRVTCRHAYVEYPVGERVSFDGCGDTYVCSCGGDGQWVECGGVDRLCSWNGPTRSCSEMFPELGSGDAPPSDALQVVGSEIDGNVLRLDIEFTGAIDGHDFVLCYRYSGEEYPLNIDLFVVHDSHEDERTPLAQESLAFNPQPIAADYMVDYASNGDIVATPYGLYAFGELSCEAREQASRIEVGAATSAASTATSTPTVPILRSARAATTPVTWCCPRRVRQACRARWMTSTRPTATATRKVAARCWLHPAKVRAHPGVSIASASKCSSPYLRAWTGLGIEEKLNRPGDDFLDSPVISRHFASTATLAPAPGFLHVAFGTRAPRIGSTVGE